MEGCAEGSGVSTANTTLGARAALGATAVLGTTSMRGSGLWAIALGSLGAEAKPTTSWGAPAFGAGSSAVAERTSGFPNVSASAPAAATPTPSPTAITHVAEPLRGLDSATGVRSPTVAAGVDDG